MDTSKKGQIRARLNANWELLKIVREKTNYKDAFDSLSMSGAMSLNEITHFGEYSYIRKIARQQNSDKS